MTWSLVFQICILMGVGTICIIGIVSAFKGK